MSVKQSNGNLPADLSSFVGRADQLAALKRTLTQTRLVTLTGPGGVGKTRLATRLGRDRHRVYRDGVWLIELAALADPELLVPTLASTFKVQDWNTRPAIEAVLEYLADRQLLLILDNCEHLAQACAPLVRTLLSAAPNMQIIVTSRQPLNAPGEHILSVPPLALPAPETALPLAEARHYEAMALFADRAAAACPGFTVGSHNLASVVELCRELDGIPLAIELAVVRLRALTVEQIRARLKDRFSLLARTTITVLPHHQTLRAAITWSYDLCSPAEQLLWARASVFAGGFDLDAVEDVCAGDGIDHAEVLDLVTGLVDKSILTRRETADSGVVRYVVLESIRAYGLEQLGSHDEEVRLQRRHCEWLLALAERSTIEWWGCLQLEWMTRLRAEHTNLRAALEFCVSENEAQLGLKLVGGLRFYWVASWLLTEVRQWVDRLDQLAPEHTVAYGVALWVAGWAAIHQGDRPAAEASARRCRELAQTLTDDQMTAHAIHLNAEVALTQGDLPRAHTLYDEALDAYRELVRTNVFAAKTMVMASLVASMVASLDDRAEDAVHYAEESLRITSTHQEKWAYSCGLTVHGLALWRGGQAQEAIPRLRESIAIKEFFKDLFGLGLTNEILAWCLATVGKHEQAAHAFGVADRIWPLIGVQLLGSPPLLAHRHRSEMIARTALGDATFDVIHRTGTEQETLRQDDIVVLDQEIVADVPAAAADSSPLTRREWEVAVLVSCGLANKEIATKLVVAKRTAEAHVENILKKLGFTSRAQIAVWVRERSSAALTSSADGCVQAG